MRNTFVETSNVARVLRAIRTVEARRVDEHVICVISGDAGRGKSKTAVWWGIQHNAVIIACSPLATPGWVLRDIVRELGDTPRRSHEEVKQQAVQRLSASRRALVIDEVEHALDRGAVALDDLRQVAELCEVPLILVGREGTPEKLRRHRQIWRRIGAVAELEAVSLSDIRLLADGMCEVAIADDVIAAIHAASEGRIDQAIADLAKAEAMAKRGGAPTATLAAIDADRLGHPWANRDARVTSLASAKARRKAS